MLMTSLQFKKITPSVRDGESKPAHSVGVRRARGPVIPFALLTVAAPAQATKLICFADAICIVDAICVADAIRLAAPRAIRRRRPGGTFT